MLECKKERIEVRNIFANFCKFSALLAAVVCADVASADQAPNPRSATVANVAPARADGAVVKRGGGKAASVVSDSSRSSVRRPMVVQSRNADSEKKKTARTALDVRQGTPALMRSATGARSAVGTGRGATNNARSAINTVKSGFARAATKARATAVFSDISKIGGGYSDCRDAYATCMDQFCANANDTYRRCFCSARFTEFYDMEQAMDQAKVLLQRFEDNNLNAVDKTAEEVDAMYSATVGEAAIKKDTSGAQSILNEIGDLLSGKKKAVSSSATTTANSGSLGVISLDFSTDMGDIWGGNGDFGDGGESLFDNSKAVDMTDLEGIALYNASNKQCLQVMKDSCENSAILNMATSAYNIMITQDCNMYEKSLNKKREQVLTTVRQAEKILREARLEEYRAHNSRDVNECISKVQTAMFAETACGANYKRCLDYSGAYINPSTGGAVYSPRLFELTNIITLEGATGNTDLLGQNPAFDKFLETKKMYAESALDSCRTIADNVWTEFKRMALIEIAQAQDAKIEEVKMSCVQTMSECYDKQSSALKSFDDTTAKTSGAISAYAAKAMCEDKVMACASLYGDNQNCKFDGNGRLVDENGNVSSGRCGLTELLAFVDAVDNVRVAEGCDTAIETQLKEWCTPTDGSKEAYPWNCRQWGLTDLTRNVYNFAVDVCADPTNNAPKPNFSAEATLAQLKSAMRGYGAIALATQNKIDQAINEIRWQLEYKFIEKCEELNGYWIDADVLASDNGGKWTGTADLTAFYTALYGKGSGSTVKGAEEWGRCVENTTRVLCEAYNSNVVADKSDVDEYSLSVPLAIYDAATDECKFSAEWYQRQCQLLGNGYYENGVCYVTPEN